MKINKNSSCLLLFCVLFFIRVANANISDYMTTTNPNIPAAKEKEFIGSVRKWYKDNYDYDRPILIWASIEGLYWFVDMLVRNNEPIDTEEKNGGNALSAAILNKRESIVSYLLAHGADPKFTYKNDMKGVKPIILAAQSGDVNIINMLVNKGVDVNYVVPDKYSTTPLYIALFHYQLSAAKTLIEKGATFKPYYRSDGRLVGSVRRNACQLKSQYQSTFRYVKCNAEIHKAKPGFMCSKATSKVEKMICKESKLAILDSELSKVYKTSTFLRLESIAKNQRKWLKERNRCERDKNISLCLESKYKSRLKKLLSKVAIRLINVKNSYVPDLSVKKTVVSDNDVVYLISENYYKYGVINKKYYFSTFTGSGLNSFKYCEKSTNDSDGSIVNGDVKCTLDNVTQNFLMLGK